MDFTSKETRFHILQPIAYNRIRKICKVGARVHSAYDQYNIHCLAHEFASDILKIPKPHMYEAPSAYIMDQIPDVHRIPERHYESFPELVVALLSFSQYMISNGYWPYDFSIFQIQYNQFVLVDFSRFGYIDSKRVRFPKYKDIYTLDEVSMFYGLKIYEDHDFVNNSKDNKPIDIFRELLGKN